MNTTTAFVRAGVALTAAALLVSAPLAASAEPETDTTPPTTTFNVPAPPPSGWYALASVPIRLVASDDASGVASISYRVGDGPVVTTPGGDVSLAISAEGVTTVTAWAVDGAGNVEEAHGGEFRIDRTAPTIGFDAPALVELDSAVPFVYDCSDAHAGVASCTAAIASGDVLPSAALGAQAIEVTAVDHAGHTTVRTFGYEVVPDLTAPSVWLAIAPEPASGWYTSGVGVTVEATDASGIDSVHWNTSGAVSTNGDAWGRPDDWTGFNLSAEGVTEVSMWAYDSYGNRGEGTHTVRIDTVAPSVSAGRSLAAPEFRIGERVVLPVDCADATSGVAECGIVEAPEGLLATDELGAHTVTLFGVDVAGNRAEAEYAYRVVDAATGGSDGGTGGTGSGTAGAPRPGTLAATGLDLPGLVMLGGLLLGAGLAAVGMRRRTAR